MKYTANHVALHIIITLMGLGLALNLGGCASSTSGQAALQLQPAEPIAEPPQTLAHDVLARAFSQVGNPYRYGGNKPETGFDCSGFVNWVYEPYQIKLSRSSRDLYAHGEYVEREDLRPGDLVFFGRKKRITHVGYTLGIINIFTAPAEVKKFRKAALMTGHEESIMLALAESSIIKGLKLLLPV